MDMAKYNTYGKLCRYEAHIERGLYKALHELQRLQAARCGQPVSAPLALDVDVSGTADGLNWPESKTDFAKRTHSLDRGVCSHKTCTGNKLRI